MSRVGKKESTGFEDLMKELSQIEQHMLREDRSCAMSLMVLEAKLRERFQQLEYRIIEIDPTYQLSPSSEENIFIGDPSHLIPYDLPNFPSLEELEKERIKKRTIGTVGTAAVLAIATALGVFGLASILQLALTWLA